MDRLIASDEAPALDIRDGPGPLVVVCEHASNRLPRGLGTLGLTADDLRRHIAWDPGALEVAAGVADGLGGTLVTQRYSRLVVDCNRDASAPDAIATVSEDTPIPGNAALGETARAARFAEVWGPFHEGLARLLDRRQQAGRASVLVTVHTFTPVWLGTARPWHVGVISTSDRNLAEPVLAALSREAALIVGDNQPYSARDNVDYTIRRHGLGRGLPHVMIEIRNDLVASPQGQAAWTARLTDVFRPLLATGVAA